MAASNTEQVKALYARNEAAGWCRCGQHLPVPGRKRCRACLVAAKKYRDTKGAQRQWGRHAAGLDT